MVTSQVDAGLEKSSKNHSLDVLSASYEGNKMYKLKVGYKIKGHVNMCPKGRC
jgi:hypothetical protein